MWVHYGIFTESWPHVRPFRYVLCIVRRRPVKFALHTWPNEIITVRNSSCGKVMFSQDSVILSTGGACMARGCAWQWVCVAGTCMAGELYMAGGMHGRGGMLGRGACMVGGHAWQEIWPLQRTAYILLKCILVCSAICQKWL